MLMQFEMLRGPPSTFSATHSFSAVSSTQAWPNQNYLRDALQKTGLWEIEHKFDLVAICDEE